MSSRDSVETIDLVIPVHNEGESIAGTLRELHQVVRTNPGVEIRFIVCEDGSRDNTVAVLEALSDELPIHLITSPQRKGYSRAVIDGFSAATSRIVAFVDSDGQCDPRDFAHLYHLICKDDVDLVIGYRNPRSDHWIRLLMSKSFGVVYKTLFAVPVRDPSCPYLLIKRASLKQILAGNVGILKQGFWWEFLARAFSLQLSVVETPVAHRLRTSGETQVYKPAKVPRIAFEHIIGLFQLKGELRHTQARAKHAVPS